MKELEDTHCEVKKIVELQYPNWDLSNTLNDESSEAGSPRSNGYSNILGGFLEDTNYAWFSSGPKLVVFNTKNGRNISSWTFKERISCVSPFPNQPGQLPLLLVGTDNNASRIKDSYGMVCIFNCTTSQVVRAIKVPTGVEQLCVINGGVEWEELIEKRVNNPLLENSSGLACVTLRNLDHLMIDLRRNSWDNPLRFPCADESNPAEVDILDSRSTSRQRANREKHAVCNLMNELIERHIGFKRDEFESSILYQESLTTVLICSRKIGCLISGCLGRVIIWQNDGVVRWISPAVDDNLMISHLALLEPTDDPRPFCYLWIAYQDESALYCPILKMYAMLFERKCADKGINFYFNLEGEPSLKFELELEEKSKVISLDPIVRESNPEQTESGNKRGEDSLLLINIEGKSILFDLNQWYKEQMPRFLGECQNVQAILSSYSTKSEISSENTIVNCSYVTPTLKEFSFSTSTPPEEFFFPNSLNFEWIQLGVKKLIVWMTRGVQAQLLRELVMAGPIIVIQPTESYHSCITTGLIPFNSDLPYNNDLDSQRDAILTLCLEQRWTTFLLKCAKEWSDGSAAYLYPAFLRWSIQRASTIKLSTHEMCIPLFDQSGNSIGEAEVKTLRFFAQQMECLCNIINNLPIETEDVEQQRRALRRISMYLEILLWFYDVGLLPETQDMDEEMLPISLILRIPYPVDKLVSIYKEKREQFAKNVRVKQDNEEDLFIDELITRECPALRWQWEQESNEDHCGGHYPPPSLQSLLRSCVIDCYNPDSNEMENKHQIIIYLLMDLVMLLQGSCPNVDQLIKYPSAFKFSPGLIKLTQALFLLDHEDYQGFLDIMTGQLVFDSDIKDWHHRLVMRTLLRSNQSKLALIYLRVRKPPLSSIDDQSIAVILSVERGLVQSAFHRRPPTHYTELLMRFFRACKVYGKLNDILHLALNSEEEEAFIHFLEQEKCDETRLLYYLQRCRYTDANTVFLSDPNIKNLAKIQKPTSLSIFHAYNSTLPEISRRLTSNFIQNNIEMDSSSRCPRPMSHQKSRVKTREIYETAIRKAKETFIRRPLSERSRIPFLTAPCLLGQPILENADTNSVMFVERARTFHGKRSFDDMRDEDIPREENPSVRKRQKISDMPEKVNESIAELETMCRTPLIKRKSQIPLTKEISNETPQSILKIRQLIRDSTSPSGKVSSSEDERASEKEKKPRQIRFSINQPKINDSIVEDMEVCDENVTGKAVNEEEGVKPLETSEEQTEVKKSPSPQRISLSPKNVSQQREGSTESDAYFSPNASTRSINESSVLTDSSTYHSKSISGPRCRPRLRRSQLYDSQTDVTKKSSVHNTSSESITDSIESTVDAFLKSDIVSSTFIDGFVLKTPRSRARLSVLSQCASAVLTPDTSVEIPCPQPNRILKSPSVSPSTTKKDDSDFSNHSDKEKSTVNSQQYSSTKTTVVKKIIVEDVDDQSDEIESIEIVDEIEKETAIKSEVKEETTSVKVQEIIKEKHDIIISSDSSTDEQLLSENKEEDEVTNNQNNEVILEEAHEDEIVIIENNDIVEEDYKESLKGDDYEDELVALKYHEEENDVYESFHDSEEINQPNERPASNTSQMRLSPKKTPVGRFYEEFNITDDESSRSFHSDMMEKMVPMKTESVENFSQATTIILSDSVNITDDETSDSNGSLRFKISDIDKNTNDNLTNETETPVFDLKDKDQEPVTEIDELSQPQKVESIEEIITSDNVEQIVIPEDTTPIRMTRSRRASSVAPTSQESASETPETRSMRTRRANSLAKDIFSPAKLTPTVSSSSNSPVDSPIKRGRGRRSVSMIKEVLTTSILPERILGEMNETTSGQKRLRRAVSLQKEITEPVKLITKDLKSVKDSSSIDETSEQEPDIPKKTRGRRAVSVNKEIDKSTVVPRKTRGASVVKEDDGIEKNNKPKRVRATSTSSEIAQEAIVENSHPAKRTRTASVSKEPANGSVVKESKPKRTRAASVAKEDSKETVKVEEDSNEVTISRKTRAASVSQDSFEETSKRVRGGSVAKDSVGDTVRKTRGTSVAKEDAEETAPRKKRAASVSKDIVEESTKKTRGGSVAKEGTGETAPRRKRTASVSKESVEESSITSQKVRGTSVTKDSTEDVESTSKRVTRRKASTKDKSEEKIKTKKSNIVNDVIPEEDDDEEETIFDRKITRRGSKNIEENVDITTATRKTRATSIAAIPEEDEEIEEIQKKVKPAGKGRMRRAVSVDLTTIETKRRTRGLAKSAISEEHNEEEESHQTQTDTEMKSTKVPTRRKRAASETKDVNNTVISVKPKRNTKGSQKKSDTDAQQSTLQEVDHSSETEMNDDVFSPPTVSSNTRSAQPRRPITTFITPLTKEEEEKIEVKIKQSKKPGQTRRTLNLFSIRTKFVIRSQHNSQNS